MTEKIEVKDITQTRDEKDGPHAQHQLDVHISFGVLTCCLVDVVG